MKDLILNNLKNCAGTRINIDLIQIMDEVKGNFLEIGAGFGLMTKHFGKLALNYDRKVLVIDPFEEGWEDMPESYKYAYSTYQASIRECEDAIILHKKSSLDASVPRFIKKYLPIGFAFVDGLQYKEAVLSDLRMMEKFKAKIICVDDIERTTGESQVPEAVKEFLETSEYVQVVPEEPLREGYFVHKSDYT